MKGEYFMMKKHGLRRFFSLLLAVFMVCTLLPTAALAEDTTGDGETQTVVVDEKKPKPPAQEDPETFTVTYTDGADDAVFDDEVYSNLPSGTATPTFSGTLAWEGHTFVGWNPEVAETVTGDVTYVAKWEAVKSAGAVHKAPTRQSNSTVVLHWSSGAKPTGFKVGVGSKINGYAVTKVGTSSNGWEVTIDLETYNVHLNYFRIPLPEEIWTGVKMQYNPQTTVSAATSGAQDKTPGSNALLGNGENTFYYFNVGEADGGSSGGDSSSDVDLGGNGRYTIKFTIVYHSNYPNGTDNKVTVKYTVKNYARIYTVSSGQLKSYSDCGFSGYDYLSNGKTWYRDKACTSTLGALSVSDGGTYNVYAGWKTNTPEETYTVTYTDGVDGEEVFADQKTSGLKKDDATPAFKGGTPIRDGYTFVRWNPEVSTTVTGNQTYTAIWEENPTALDKPTEQNVIDTGVKVLINCTSNTKHGSVPCILTQDAITDIGTPAMGSDGKYYCDVTVSSESYVREFNALMEATHSPASEDGRVRLFYNKDRDVWQAPSNDSGAIPIVFNVACTVAPPQTPPVPDHDKLSELIGKITVKCINDAATHTPKSKEYDLKEASYTPGTINGDSENGYTYTITIKSEKYVDDFDTTTLVTHSPKTGEATVTLEYKGKETGWTVKSGASVSFDVECEKKPYTPGNGEVKKLLGENAVKIICSNEEANHGEKTFGLIDGTFSVVRSGYNCEVKINSFNEYVYAFNEELSVAQGTHASDASKADKSIINLKWENGEWNVVDAPAMHYVVCMTETAPAKPEPADLGNIVKVTCTTTTAHGTETYPLTAGDFSIGNVTGNAKDGYTCTITAKAAKYVASYIGTKGAHTYAGPESKSVTLNWNATTKKWDVPEGTAITFEVTCDDEIVPPTAPTFKELPEISVIVDCGTTTEHKDATWLLLENTYEVGKVELKNDVYTCILTVKAGKYVDAYNSATMSVGKHELNDDSTKDIVLTWKDGKWTAEKSSVTFKVKCKLYTVTYEDGAKGKAFKTQEYTDLAYGSATPKFDGTPKRSGYTFTGWSPKVTDTVTKDVTYVAQWKSTKNGKDNVPKTGDGQIVMILGSVLLFSFCGATAVCLNDRKRKQG